MVKKVFEQICKGHGFMKHADNLYVRCIGDGIFQSIYCGFKKYVDINSPFYDKSSRKSQYISIGVYSMFSRIKQEMFDPTEPGGGVYCPSDFCPSNSGSNVFHGIECEYDKMNAYVFTALDNINTQEALLDFYNKFRQSTRGGILHSLTLVEPYLITGRSEDALIELSFYFTHTCVGRYYSLQNTTRKSPTESFCEKAIHIDGSLEEVLILWRAVMGRRHQEVYTHILEQYRLNVERVKQFNIPILEGYQARDIPNIF